MASLLLRRGHFYCRIIVPLGLRATLQRSQLWKSLHTRSRDRATLSADQWERRVLRLFVILYRRGPSMTREQIDTLVREYVAASLETVEEYSLITTDSDDRREANSLAITDFLEEATGELVNNDFVRVAATADSLLKKHGFPVERDSLDWKRLCRGLLVGFQEVLRTELRSLEGEYSLPTVTTPTSALPLATKLFSEVLAVYFKENARAPRTDAQIRAAFQRFLTVIGGDKPIGDITKADCRNYKETLLKSVGASTLNKHLHSLSHLFQWAAGQGFVPEDYQPVRGLLLNKRLTRQEKQERKPFTDAQLSAILTHPDFIKQRTGDHPERYWLILCLLWTGTRREEIAQLLLTDICTEGNIHYLNITNEGEQQSLKTLTSKRRVPIHSVLVHGGFLSYVEQLRRAGDARGTSRQRRLFPNLQKGKNGYGDAVGKYFARLLRVKLQLTDPALVLHSLRHTVVSRLRDMGVPQDIRETLVGHSAETVHGSTYGHREETSLKLLAEHLERLNFPSK